MPQNSGISMSRRLCNGQFAFIGVNAIGGVQAILKKWVADKAAVATYQKKYYERYAQLVSPNYYTAGQPGGCLVYLIGGDKKKFLKCVSENIQ
jgi:hypothetical protein